MVEAFERLRPEDASCDNDGERVCWFPATESRPVLGRRWSLEVCKCRISTSFDETRTRLRLSVSSASASKWTSSRPSEGLVLVGRCFDRRIRPRLGDEKPSAAASGSRGGWQVQLRQEQEQETKGKCKCRDEESATKIRSKAKSKNMSIQAKKTFAYR